MNKKIGRKNHNLENLNSKTVRKTTTYLVKLNLDIMKQYNFLSTFLTNEVLNFFQELYLLYKKVIQPIAVYCTVVLAA